MTIQTRQPTVPITEMERDAFCRTDEPLVVKPLVEELQVNVRWQRIPREYLHLTSQELDERIAGARQELGKRLVILGHHYQRDDIIKFADYRGDSYMLAQRAAAQPEADHIVFCGVHFMAETADVLSADHQQVILPNITAGCSMADMAPTEDVYDLWDQLAETLGEGETLPVTYMNSTAGIKALCGKNGGIVCTSSSAPAALRWAFERASRIVFFPDQHLGRNTGLKLGIPLEQMVVWNPFKPLGGLTPQQLRDSRLILWQGHCSVHTRFTVAQIQAARQRYPSVRVVVHPECTMEVVQAADDNGSTEHIVRSITQSPPGSVWAVGTEISLVKRLADQNPDKTVFCLDSMICPCSTMYRIHPAYLAWVLEGLVQGQVINRVSVDEETKHWAKVALERMLQVR